MIKKEIAIYGKGGIGKSTLASNISAALACLGEHVLQIGCDPKHDSTRLLTGGRALTTVLDYIRDTAQLDQKPDDILAYGYRGTGCIEAGGPKPGVGCAGRGIITAFELLDRFNIKNDYDAVVYDVLGDVVCGGFAVPIRREYANEIFVVTSGEYMSIYAANNILRGIENYDLDEPRIAGIIYNSRNVKGEDERVAKFAKAVGLPVLASIPRSPVFEKLEKKNMTAAEAMEKEASDGSGDSEREELGRIASIFSDLASRIKDGTTHYKASPLTDEDLEVLIMGTEYSSYSGGEKSTGSDNSSDSPANLDGDFSTISDSGDSITLTEDGKNTTIIDNNEKAELTGGENNSTNFDASDAPLSKNVIRDEPLHGCAFNGAAGMSVHVRDAVVLLHAPKSCAYLTYQTITSTGRRSLYERGAILPVSLIPGLESTFMTESDMVFGGTDKLLGKVKEITEREDPPKAVIVVSACPAGIIGDDIDKAKELSTPECPVYTVKADGNLSGDYLQGMLMTYTSLAEQIIDRSVKPEPDTVNIVFEKVVLKNAEINFGIIKDFLSMMGVKVNCRFLYDTSFESIRNFMSASLNLLAYKDYTGNILKEFFEDKFGAKFFDQQFPVGFYETSDWLRGVSEHFDKGGIAEEIISKHKEEYEERIAAVRPLLQGKKLFIVTFNHDIDWFLGAALDAGIDVVKIGVLNFSQDEGFRTRIPEVRNIDIVENYDRDERYRDIERLRPDIILGNYSSDDLAEGVIVDTIPMAPDVGFFSGVKVIERWAELGRSGKEGEWEKDRELFDKYYG